MKRRSFFTKSLLILILSSATLSTNATSLFSSKRQNNEEEIKIQLTNNEIREVENYAKKFAQNKDFLILKKKIEYPGQKDKEIITYFNYDCPLCDRVYKALDRVEYQNPEYSFLESPIAIENKGKVSLVESNLYFSLTKTIKNKRLLKDVNRELFTKIRSFDDVNELATWLAKEKGVNKDLLLKHFESNETSLQSLFLTKHLKQLPILSMPMIVINGKFIITSDVIQKYNEKELIELINYILIINKGFEK